MDGISESNMPFPKSRILSGIRTCPDRYQSQAAKHALIAVMISRRRGRRSCQASLIFKLRPVR